MLLHSGWPATRQEIGFLAGDHTALCREGTAPINNMIISIMELTPIADKRQAVLEILRFTEDRARRKAGCMGCGVYEANDERGTILYLERWRSREDLHRHIQSSLYLGILNAMDLGQEAPEISFHEVLDTESMELVEVLRGSHG